MYPRIHFLLILLLGCHLVTSADPDFPFLDVIAPDRYETGIELVDQIKLSTAFALDTYDNKEKKGHLEIQAAGFKSSYYYYHDPAQIITVNSTSCLVEDVDLSEMYYEDTFFGWLNRNPFVIGPSALLRRADQDRPTYIAKKVIRHIDCMQFSVQVRDNRSDVNIDYYFSGDKWTTPFSKKLTVPVRIVVDGKTSRLAEDSTDFYDVKYIIDFIYFRPSVQDPLRFEPPVGLGCHSRDTGNKYQKPNMTKKFTFMAERFDILKESSEAGDSEVDFNRVWFDGIKQVARLDTNTLKTSLSLLFDFRTGVVYQIKDTKTCNIKPIRNSMFENYDDDSLVGYIKEPEQVLGLSGDFYYMGERTMRGIKCRVFESAKKNYFDQFSDTRYYMFVTTAYFALDEMKTAVEGDDVKSPPLFILLSGYKDPNVLTYRTQFSIFGYEDIVGLEMYNTFKLETCFPMSEQKSYFVLGILSGVEEARKMESVDTVFLEKSKSVIIKAANITEIRLPFLKADYLPNGIFLTGLMVDRPAFMAQFWVEFHGISTTTTILEMVLDAKNEEACAKACVEMTKAKCRRFHFCGEDCFLNSDSITETPTNAEELGECTVYVRAEFDSKNIQDDLPKALKNLQDAVTTRTLALPIPYKEGEEDVLLVTEVGISDGPFNKVTEDYPYTLIFNGFQINSALDSMTTVEVPSADTENDCYRSCRDDTSISCSSFSYCFTGPSKMCRLSSVLMDGRETNQKEITKNENCNVFSLKYLSFFDKYHGKVVLVPGEKQLTQIDSAEECAQACKNENSFTCRGFERCKNRRLCVLHTKHVLDLKEGESASATADCVHYAVKYISDYDNYGHTLIDDETKVRNEITLEECARACSEEDATCRSFNYCPATGVGYTDSTCSLISTTLGDAPKTKENDKCFLYSQRYEIGDWAKPDEPIPTVIIIEKGVDVGGYTSGGFAGVIVGTLIFGLFMGALGFVVYSYLRSKRGGEGMTVRFMKQDSA